MDEVSESSHLPTQADDTPEDPAKHDREELEESLRQPAEAVPLAEVDPRISAVAAAPPTSADLLRLQRQVGTHHLPDLANRIAGLVNPLADQMGPDAAAGEGAAPDGTAAETRGQRLARRTNQLLNHARDNGAPVPRGDSLKEKSQHGLGQGAGLALLYFFPGTTKFLRSGLGRKVAAPVRRSRIGRKIPEATWDGLLGGTDPAQGRAGRRENGKNGKNRTAEPGEGSGSGHGRYRMMLTVGVPVLACTLVFLLILGLLGVGAWSGDDDSLQPEESSDRKIAAYLPGGWQRVLQQAADRVEEGGAEDYAVVPWTILAGVVAAQTDFGRYSPYDAIDRDPGRKAKTIPTSGGGGGGGGGRIESVNTGGAGPGPIKGVKGAGSTRTVGESGHVAPPAGPLANQLGWFLYALRMYESGGVYNRPTGAAGSDACGAYQYTSTTWHNYKSYRTACDAPPSVQDERAREDTIKRFNNYGNWQQTAAAHFFPKWAASPSQWHKCPSLCNFNPPMWSYVDGVMKKMREAARAHPARAGTSTKPRVVPAAAVFTGPLDASSATSRTGSHVGYAGAAAGTTATGVFADGCPVANPAPGIGGKSGQGTGPFLLSPAAAGQMQITGKDPQNPCDAAEFAAQELSSSAKRVHADPQAPRWKPGGSKDDQKEARKYWSRVIQNSGIFVERGADPDAPCSLPPAPEEEPWSVSFKIISIWRCEVTRLPELYLVTGVEEDEDGKIAYTVETDRSTATEILVGEALSVSYGSGKWKTDECDNDSAEPQGIFPMTKREAAKAKLKNRCDVDKNITAAAKLVLSMEKVKPQERPKKLGEYQPMVGGWQNLGIAVGEQLRFISRTGPGTGSFQTSDACGKVMKKFLTGIAPHASQFAELEEPPESAEVDKWTQALEVLEHKYGIEDPGGDEACSAGEYLPGYNATLAQIAVGLADSGKNNANLIGLGNYFEAMENSGRPARRTPVIGEDTLVLPRLSASGVLEPIDAPLAEDATEAWSLLGSTEGVTIPLPQVAVEYAWFFGGVIRPFGSAGERIGSLGEGSATAAGTVQTTVGPDGCPQTTPPNTLRVGNGHGITIAKLCADSVAKARSPQAAMAIKWALTHLGLIYSQKRRNEKGYADCSSFVSKAYRDSNAVPTFYPKGGNAPTTDTLRTHPLVVHIPLSALQPGDLIEPNPGHVVMQLADGFIVHDNHPGDFSHVTVRYFALNSSVWAARVDPSKA